MAHREQNGSKTATRPLDDDLSSKCDRYLERDRFLSNEFMIGYWRTYT